ncbi:MAG: hypothetical protein MUE85_06210 [Microscillaceae bacterium]|jgi:hypothetical protein|nr:hypothetical protein [Microscillaceae bacterium]
MPIYEKYQQYSYFYPRCYHLQKADFPAEMNVNLQYDNRVVALTAYFSVYQYISFGRLKALSAQVFQSPPFWKEILAIS